MNVAGQHSQKHSLRTEAGTEAFISASRKEADKQAALQTTRRSIKQQPSHHCMLTRMPAFTVRGLHVF